MGSSAILDDSLTLCCELLSKSLKVIYAFKNNKLLKPLLNASSMPGPMPGLEVIVINLYSPYPFKAHCLWEDRHRLATILDRILSSENGETESGSTEEIVLIPW